MSCVFCEIASGSIGAEFVVQNEKVVGFLDTKPVFKGHVLIVPRAHVVTLDELSPDALVSVFQTVQSTMRALEVAGFAEGTFVAINNKISQSVLHLHVHVVPRRKKDGLRGFFWPRQKYASPEEMAEVAAAIRNAITTGPPAA